MKIFNLKLLISVIIIFNNKSKLLINMDKESDSNSFQLINDDAQLKYVTFIYN